MGFFDNDDEFESIVRQFFGENGRRSYRREYADNEDEERIVDFIEEGNEFFVIFEMPGYDKEDVKVEVNGRVMEIVAKKKAKEKIALDLSKIEKDKENTANIKVEYEARLRLVDVEAQKLIQAAAQEGRKITEETRQKAREEAHEIVENARKAVQFELEKAKKELKEELVDITIKAAENLIEEKLTKEQDRRIVEDFLQKIEGVE